MAYLIEWTKSDQELLSKLNNLKDEDLYKLLIKYNIKPDYIFINGEAKIRSDDRINDILYLLEKNTHNLILKEIKIFEPDKNNNRKELFEIYNLSDFKKIYDAYSEKNFIIVQIDGNKIKSENELFSILKDQLKFPFFGENWDALEDCMLDLSWLNNTDVMISISNPDNFTNPDIRSILPPVLIRAKNWHQNENFDFIIAVFR